MPRWLTRNFIKNTIPHFNRFLQIQGHEPVYLLKRKWKGEIIEGIATDFSTFDITLRDEKHPYVTYSKTFPYFVLWDSQNSLIRGRPRIRSIQIFIDGAEATRVDSEEVISDNSQYFVSFDPGTPTSSNTHGTIFVGFNEGFDPASHIISYSFEEICLCVPPDDQDAFRPGSMSTCEICYGTGYVGGYDQYLSAPQVECGKVVQPENTILVRFPMRDRRARLEMAGFELENLNAGWTAATPELTDWDVLVRRVDLGAHVEGQRNPHTTERYWVTQHSYSTLRFDPVDDTEPVILHQNFMVQEIQFDHVLYQFPIAGLDMNFGTLTFAYNLG